jgi:hypothetical protein
MDREGEGERKTEVLPVVQFPVAMGTRMNLPFLHDRNMFFALVSSSLGGTRRTGLMKMLQETTLAGLLTCPRREWVEVMQKKDEHQDQ